MAPPRRIILASLLLASRLAPADEPPAPSETEALRAELAAQRAELEELRAESIVREVEKQKEPAFRIYGFMDVGLQKAFLDDNAMLGTIMPSAASTFVLGNLNLYLDAQPIENWSALVEVRLTNAPDGADVAGGPGVTYRREDNTVYDVTSASGGWARLRWGALVLERAYVQWRLNDYLTVRAGSWLTPYGIWNVDHGSPTLISLMLPQMVTFEYFPARQTGLQLLGTLHLDRWDLQYTGYVSNGRGLGQLDPTEDKAVGGRVVLARSVPYRLAVGGSFFIGTYAEEQRATVSVEPYRLERTIDVAYHERGLGADVSLDWKGLRLRSELTVHQIRNEEGKRGLMWGIPTLYMADRNELAWYGLAAYQLPWLGLEPYLFFEWLAYPSPTGEGNIMPAAGVNVHFTHATQLKVQASYLDWWGEWQNPDEHMLFFATRAVVAF